LRQVLAAMSRVDSEKAVGGRLSVGAKKNSPDVLKTELRQKLCHS
jgi:hypothetical protein